MDFYKGLLKHWNDDKGFGFIETDNGKGQIFIHISALKRMIRRPAVGDMINYQIHIDNEGKNRAVNARIEGVKEIQPRMKRSKNMNHNNNQVSIFITIVILIAVIFYIYNKIVETKSSPIAYDNPSEHNEAKVTEEKTYYSCDGKIYCPDMTSCEEAMFYLKNCPGTKMDGDGDGIPCESQWCNN